MTTTLITRQQQADAANRVAFVPLTGGVVMGLYNQRIADAATLDEATDALKRLGYTLRNGWVQGASGGYTARVELAR